MKRRQVGYNRVADEDDFNNLADYQEDNLQLFAQDCGFAGCVLSGGAVTPDSPVSWNVILGASAMRDSNGDRINVASPETIDMEPADPGAGNEVYVSAFIAYDAQETEPDVDGHGVAYYKDYDDGYVISVVEGTPALLGNATKPAIQSGKLSVCDVLVTDTIYARGTILAEDIDISRQAAFEWPDELGQTTITDTTESTTKDTGALIVEGGVGVEKRINAGGKISTAGQLESTLAIGTAPLAVTSTTKVANLNVDQVDGCDVETALTAGTDKVPRSDAVTTALNEYQAMINYIINGGMQTAQRGTSFTAATTPANNDDTYLLDRWVLLSDGNDIVDVSQSTDAPDGYTHSMKFLVATANKKFGVVQLIENKIAKRLQGKTVSFSVQAKTTGGAVVENIRMALLAWDSTADTVTSDVVSAWNAEGANPTWAANWTAENTAANQAITTSWAEYSVQNVTVDTASMANLALVIWVDDTDCAANDELYITGVMLNVGATSHEFVPFGGTYISDLRTCKRYYYENPPVVGTGYTVGTLAARMNAIHPVTMRIAPPTVTILNTTTFLDGDNVRTSTGTVNNNFSTAEFFQADFAVDGITTGNAISKMAGTGKITVDAEL